MTSFARRLDSGEIFSKSSDARVPLLLITSSPLLPFPPFVRPSALGAISYFS